MNCQPQQADLFVLFFEENTWNTNQHKPTKTLPPENKRSAVRWDDFFAILPPYRLVVVFLKDFCIWKHLDPWGGWNMIQFDERAYVSKKLWEKTTNQLYQCWNQGEEISRKIGLTTGMVLQAAKRLEKIHVMKTSSQFSVVFGKNSKLQQKTFRTAWIQFRTKN